MPRCVICDGPTVGPTLMADDSGHGLHPGCLAEHLPYDAAVALISAAALFLVPFIRVWSA